MSGNQHVPTIISFGPFEADLHTQELRKQGLRLRLPGQSFQILKMLLERPGELVTREELQQALWPSDTHVDFERGVNAAVNRLREVMGDSADAPRLIETLPRRGYRFIGTIDVPPKPRPNWLRVAAWILAAAGVCVLVAGFFYFKNRHAASVEENMHPVPLTAYPGFEFHPGFSPDGSQVVFDWSGDPETTPKGEADLYVKVVGTENLLRLTHQSHADYPAWSPDGAQIAFHRWAGKESGVSVIPALGGPERKLITVVYPVHIQGPDHWSPDSKWLTYTKVDPKDGHQFLYLLSVETLESKPIRNNEECLYAGGAIFSHSGDQLAYFCLLKVPDNEFGIYTVRLSGGPPTLVTRFGTGWSYEHGMAWTANDKKLIFARPHRGDDFELDEVTLADGSIRKLSFGQDGTWPSISDKGDKLAYSVYSKHVDIWRKDLLHPEAAGLKLMPSTYNQMAPEYSPDGKHIAFASDRSGVMEIWMGDADGTHLVRMSDSRSSEAGTPRWSPDSQKIAFDSRHSGTAEVYVVDLADRLPRKVMTNLSSMSTPNWSHDGKWLYFESGTANKSDSRIYRCPSTGGDAVAISAESGDFPVESGDGDTLYFAGDGPDGLTIHAQDVGAPANQSVLNGMPPIGDHSNWSVAMNGIYFVPATDDSSMHYFDFKTRQVRQVFKTEKAFENGVSVSADGRWILFTQIEENSDLMLVDHFH
jgi:Tol biopolymer transport system component/DNA-binding winged helix-turn-helix (wHTH) protein